MARKTKGRSIIYGTLSLTKTKIQVDFYFNPRSPGESDVGLETAIVDGDGFQSTLSWGERQQKNDKTKSKLGLFSTILSLLMNFVVV